MIRRIRKKLNKDANLKELIIGSATSLLLKVTGMLIGYVVVMYIAKQYGTETIGVYNIILSTITFLSIFSACGMNISILRYAGEFNKKGEDQKLKQLHYYTLKIATPISIILSLLLYYFSGYLAEHFFENIQYTTGLQLAAVALPFFTMASVSVEYIRGLKIIKVSEYFRTVNRPLLNFLIIIMGSSLLSISTTLLPVYSLVIATICTCFATEFFIWRKTRKIQASINTGFTKTELIKTSLPMMITSIASYLLGNLSLFTLEIYRSTEEVGLFSIALKLSLFVSLILNIINTISAPKFSELYWSNNLAGLQKLVNQSSKLIFIISLIASLLLAALAGPVLSFVGPSFLQAKTALYILIFTQVINAVTGSGGLFLNMTGNASILRNIFLVALALIALSSLTLIPSYGILGAALTTFIGSAFVNLTTAFIIKKKLGFTTYYSPFLRT